MNLQEIQVDGIYFEVNKGHTVNWKGANPLMQLRALQP